ncbi:hypothetical protein [Cellulomonas sp. URHD0024]|uniref:hypothetical protein n=1 Tax=Cellulomonas sp. URHD0024 TaxID=1302620 RepID=UPI0006845A8B|nr:hypothetical protein [Cellulomonas sp. URHD0024]
MANVSAHDWSVFLLIVGLRLVVPLFIPRFPLPALLAALVIDGIDQTVFATFTDLPLDNYQSYDKALDIYYLTIAYLSVIRNWRNPFALGVAAALWYYRLVGVLAFELTGERWLLMLFPNTFEYFVIAIEVVRTRRDAGRLANRAFVWTAALIWVFIKLPQEWWIHVAQLDFTDEFKERVLGVPGTSTWAEGVANRPWVVVGLLVLIAVLVIVGLRLARRLPPADWPFTLDSDVIARRVGWIPRGPVAVAPRGVGHVLEKVALAGLVSMIMFLSWPLLDARLSVVFLVVAATVVAFAGLAVWRARTGRAGAVHLGVQVAVNTVISVVAMLVFAALATRGAADLSAGDVLLFAYIVALIVTLYDRYSARREAMVPSPELVTV